MSHIYDYIIIGGGVTGLAAARRIQQKGCSNFLLLEAEERTGGLCKTNTVNGHHVDVGGGHVLHTRFPEVFDWIFEHIPREDFNEFKTKVLIDLEGYPIEFPIELNLWQLPQEKQLEYLYSYVTAASKKVSYTNFEDWIRNYLGDKIADNYMLPYNKKLWCMDISKLNTDWLVKIPETNIKLILKSIIEKKSNFTEQVVSHRSFLYPKQGGFETILNSIKRHITEHIITNAKVKTLRLDTIRETGEQSWLIGCENGMYYRTNKVINAVPWPELDIDFGWNTAGIKQHVDKLEKLSNVISLWEREPYNHGAHWMYIPSLEVEQHREFYISNFALDSKPGGVMTDINRTRWIANNKRWKAGMPLYEHENIYAYPLPTKEYKAAIKNILEYSRQYNLFGLGRWGQWQYFNVDQCIKQVLEFFKDEQNFDYFKFF